jgi:magnesium transporter
LPIVDESSHLEGIITLDELIDFIDKEATENMYKMVGLAEEDRVFTPVSRSVRMRLPWTLLNLLRATLAASVVGLFEGTLHEIIALCEFEFSSAWKAVAKQVSVDVRIALAAGAVIAVAASLWNGNAYLGLVLAGAMIFNLGLMAGLSGAVSPLTLKALRFDPALGSGIIITGVTDAFGFLSFLGLATQFRGYLIQAGFPIVRREATTQTNIWGEAWREEAPGRTVALTCMVPGYALTCYHCCSRRTRGSRSTSRHRPITPSTSLRAGFSGKFCSSTCD